MTYFRRHLAAFALLGLLPSVSFAGQLPDQFTLGKFIPGDVWMYVDIVQNPDWAWLDKEWGDVTKALKASRVDQDILALALDIIGAEDVERWKTLSRDVQWNELGGSEFAIAERVGAKPIHLDYIFLTRMTPQSATANAKALTALLEQLATSLNARLDREGGLSVEHYQLHGVKVASMCLGRLDSPIKSIELFHKGDILGVTTRREAVEQIAGLMAGQPKKRAIVDMPRFKQAIARAAPPVDSVSFFDFKRLLKNVNQLAGTAAEKGVYGETGELGYAQAIAKFINLVNILDSIVVTTEMQGRRELKHSLVRFQEEKAECTLARCFLDRKPFERFDEFVPVDATAFTVDGFLNMEAVYKFVTVFIEKELPSGSDLIAKWNKSLGRLGFEPQRDLFSWWGGEMISITLPATSSMAMEGKDWVMMFRVKDTELAAQKLDAGIEFAAAAVQGTGQMLMISPASVKGEGFKEITHPVMLAFARPVIGVQRGWLMVGSSAAAINKCLDVASGDAPSILQNERFKLEGLIPTGPVLAASFKDTTRLGDELSSISTLMGMMGMGVAMNMASEDPEARDVLKLAQRIAGILGKLPPALQQIDFYRSQASIQVYDGKDTIRSEQVITYRPATPSELEADAARPR